MAPLTTFIFKVAGRCNLDCDYCYVYHHADQSWRDRPRLMSWKVVRAAARRIADHAQGHGVSRVAVNLHGGEPALAGPAWVDRFCSTVRGVIPGSVGVAFGMQSNATLLGPEWIPVLARHRLRVGVSLDGTRDANDRHRLDFAGRSSYEATVAGINLLRENAPDLFAGLLCVIDLEADPRLTYEHLASFDPPLIDFHLPEAHWDRLPPGHDPQRSPYGHWLAEVFDAWAARAQYRHGIRFFEDIVGLSLGVRRSVETLGLAPVTLAVIESDGSVEAVDTLKVTFDGAPALGLNVLHHPLDAALALPMMASRQTGTAGLCATCQRCELVSVCGGGYLPHRYSQHNGFDNPSVYCDDLQTIIRHVQRAL